MINVIQVIHLNIFNNLTNVNQKFFPIERGLMANFVLIAEALEHSSYSAEHVRWLIREGKVAGRKGGGVWLVDLDDLIQYEQAMEQLGTKKHTPKKGQEDQD